MTKYQPLYEYLVARQSVARVRMTFSEVAEVIGAPLPPSAFNDREWWANQTNTANRPQAAAWLEAGFAVGSVHQEVRQQHVRSA
jgi:hypothetical protein